MFGITKVNCDLATVWLLATDDLLKYRTSFIRQCKFVLSKMNSKFKVLTNIVDSRNEVHLRWLKWCGMFFIGEYMVNDVKFYQFVKVAQ